MALRPFPLWAIGCRTRRDRSPEVRYDAVLHVILNRPTAF